jgi:hypothetical protein
MAEVTDITSNEAGQLRYAAARVVKCLIRARAIEQPTFLRLEDYEAWELKPIGYERRKVPELLKAALATLKMTDGLFLELCESGGKSVREEWFSEGPLGDVKLHVASFVDHINTLPEAIRQAESGHRVDWVELADWDALPAFRKALDALPHAERPADYIRLDQVAALVHRTKKGLEYYKNNKKKGMPPPAIPGGYGKPDLWKYPDIRPWLEKTFGVRLPIRFVGSRQGD